MPSKLLAAAVLAVVLATGAGMPSGARAEEHPDHERARAALQAGEILPLQKVLDAVMTSYPGDILEVELEREHGRWIYELRLLQKDGVLLRLEVDAKTATVIRRLRNPPPEREPARASAGKARR